MGGKHFATNRTLYTYEKRDEHGGERYIGFLGGSLFGRFFIFKSFPIDVGIQKEYFLHLDDSDDDSGDGEFNGAYVKFFYPSKLRERKGKYRRQPSVGVKISAGNFVENRYYYKYKEFGVMTDISIRFYLTKFKGNNLKKIDNSII